MRKPLNSASAKRQLIADLLAGKATVQDLQSKGAGEVFIGIDGLYQIEGLGKVTEIQAVATGYGKATFINLQTAHLPNE